MADIITTAAIEPEEVLEQKLVASLASVCSTPVEGILAPASRGTERRLSADTFVGVSVDRASQDGDYRYRSPATYTATVTVHFSLADDADGNGFRDECRRVRSVLSSFVGDGCSALDAPSFACAEFILDSTSTSFEGGENPTSTKSYTATIKGRQITTEAN